jgi:hypothetical protein
MTSRAEREELEALRARAAALDRENAELAARTNAAIAAAQERAYWLERWGFDLDALMGRRGARGLPAAVRRIRAARSRLRR